MARRYNSLTDELADILNEAGLKPYIDKEALERLKACPRHDFKRLSKRILQCSKCGLGVTNSQAHWYTKGLRDAQNQEE